MSSSPAATTIGQTKEVTMNRKLMWAVLAIGIALVIAPLALGLPGKAAAGQRMLNGFQPIMQPDQVTTTARYYNDVFVPLGTVTPMMSAQNLAKFQAYLKGFAGMQTDAAKLVPLLAQAMHMTPAQVQAGMATQLPSMAAMLQNLPAMRRDFGGLLGTMQQNVGIFSQVPAGLAHYQPLVTTMQANVDNYRQVNSLPDFRLFTVFFVLPGALLVLLAGAGLFGGRLATRRGLGRAPQCNGAAVHGLADIWLNQAGSRAAHRCTERCTPAGRAGSVLKPSSGFWSLKPLERGSG
jgi:hypothetical protein